MLGILILLFTVLPLIELYLLFNAADAIGGMNTFAIVLFTGVAGAILAKSQGRQLILKIQQQTAQGELPTDTMFQGLLVLVGGVLLVTPGFVTDIIGFLLVLPFTRWLFLGVLKAYFLKNIKNGNFKVYTNVNVNHQQWGSSFDDSEIRDVTPPKIENEKE